MTTIFKNSDQEKITSTFEQVEKSVVASVEVSDRKLPTALDDAGLAEEMDVIEKNAATGQNYAFDSNLPEEQVSQLREYASVVGFKGKMVAVKASDETKVAEVQDDAEMKRLTAALAVAKPQVSPELAMAVGDPFKLTDLTEPSSKSDWQKVKPEQKLAEISVDEARLGSIAPIRGEYEFEKQQQSRVRRGENSLTNPDAIGALAQTQDSGERLRSEIATSKTERKAAKTSWQKEAVQTAKEIGPGALPRGQVFMTGSIPEAAKQSGLDIKQIASELQEKDASVLPNIPEQTDGEKLKKSIADRRSGIQREKTADTWEKVKGTTRPTLSDAFADALEKQLTDAGVKIK
jgi:hypothetical protein